MDKITINPNFKGVDCNLIDLKIVTKKTNISNIVAIFREMFTIFS